MSLGLQRGPCSLCGATDYPLSAGGPSLCPWCDIGKPYERIRWLQERSAALEGELRWVRQTVHQAHHDGPIEKCRKNTCDAVRQVLREGEYAGGG